MLVSEHWIKHKTTLNPPEVCPFCGSKATTTNNLPNNEWEVEFSCASDLRRMNWGLKYNAWRSNECFEIEKQKLQ